MTMIARPRRARPARAIRSARRARTPDYLEAAIERASSRPQRPAWTFAGRWLPMDLVTTRVPSTRAPMRALGVLLLIADPPRGGPRRVRRNTSDPRAGSFRACRERRGRLRDAERRSRGRRPGYRRNRGPRLGPATRASPVLLARRDARGVSAVGHGGHQGHGRRPCATDSGPGRVYPFPDGPPPMVPGRIEARVDLEHRPGSRTPTGGRSGP